jgi:hypothetical protein
VGWGGFWAEQPAWQFNMLVADLTPSGSLHDHNNEVTTFLLRRLIENPDFKRDFINRSADLLNTVFQPSNTVARVNQMAAALDPEMAEHIRRWRAPASLLDWRSNVQYLRNYANNRPQYARTHLLQRFSLRGTATLTVSVSDPGHGILRLNSLTLDAPTSAPWSGLYFRGNPITLAALAAPGHRFVRWEGLYGVNTNSVQLFLNGDLALTAVFEPEEVPPPKFTEITRLAGGVLRLRVAGQPQQVYLLQGSTNLRDWLTLQSVTNEVSGEAQVLLDNGLDAGRRFYRLRWP